MRSGKPAVIDKLIKESKGDIIIIQDSDWKFNFNNEFKLKEFLSVFDDPSVGGIAESFPVEMGKKKFSEYNFTYQMVLYSSFFWLKYQKNNLTKPWKKDIRKVNNPSMFLTNVFRKKLYKKNFTLGDDFERSVDIFNSGYSIVIFLDKKFPRMICTYNLIKFKDFFKQKIRTAIARKQLSNKRNFEINLINYYLPAIWFIFSRAWKKSFYIGFLITTWIILTLLADIISKFRKMDTKSGWKLRAER
ncbi:TPA: hypothetical protein EYQ19_00570 [Candidatus Pacearchaeota archaeon]|nr:hypothetical protein [Candidatus Pacearchaeota archaeon]